MPNWKREPSVFQTETVSSITTDQGIVHYEVFGKGRPVILLHGWLGSWGLWQKTMTFLGQYYRTYALDFWGFGESGKKQPTFEIHDFGGDEVCYILFKDNFVVDKYIGGS